MNDKERILMTIIEELDSASVLAPRDAKQRGWEIGDAAYRDDSSGHEYVHFAPWVDEKDIRPGELVLARTGGISDFKIGFVVSRLGYGRFLIREIGSNRTCDYDNERFVPIRGLTPTQLLEGDKYLFYLKVHKAFARGDDFWHRYGGVDIEDGQATIWVRERYSGLKNPTKPYPVTMTWTPKTSIKAILEALRAGGYGTRQFEPVTPPAPAPSTADEPGQTRQ